MRILVLVVLLITLGCTESRGPAASAVVEAPALSGVEVGMTLDELRAARPGVATAGYGIYVDSIDGYGIEYHFSGFAPSEGQDVGGSETLQFIRLAPRPMKPYGDLYATVEERLGPAVGCFFARLHGTSWIVHYALWKDPRVAVMRTETQDTPGTFGTLRIGALDLPPGEEREPCPEPGGESPPLN